MAKKEGLLNNLSWKFAERISAQVVTFVVSIILARVLDPSHYGLISIVTIFITLANTLVVGGFGNALIQKKDADALDFSSVLYFNIGFSVVLYAILFVAAPFIAAFYGEGYELLTPVLRVLGFRIIVAGVNSVQQAYVSKKMIFRKFFWATLAGTVISAGVGVGMAYTGFGVWALVAQYLTNTTVGTITLAISLRKRPVFHFSFARVRGLMGYGFRILGTSLLITGFEELRALIIGKLYSSKDLAFFDKGKQFPSLVVTNINSSIGAVLFPKMANEQDDIERVKATARRSIRFSSFIMSPLMLGLAAVATPFIRLLLTEKWLPSVPLLQIFCVFFLFQPIHTANMQAIKAVGRSDVYLWVEVIKKVIELVTLVAVMWISVDAIAVSMAVLATAFIFVNAFPNKKLIGYSIKEQLFDILPALSTALAMAVAVYILGVLLPIGDLPLLIIQVIVGAVLYIGLSVLIKSKELTLVLNIVKNRFLRNKEKGDV